MAALVASIALTPLAAFAKDKIEVATSSQGSLATTAYIAKQLGYFDAEDLNVDIFDGGGGSNAVATVVGGSAQIGLVGIKNASEATAKGQTLKVIGTAIRGFPASLIVRSDLAKDADLKADATVEQRGQVLKGKTIAVNDIGGSSGDFVRYALNVAGLKDNDITLINLASGAGRLAGLKAKKIDGAAANSPEPETAIAGGYATVLFDAKRDIPALTNMEYMIYAARQDYIQAHPDVVKRFLTAIDKAEQTIQKDPDAAKAAYYGYLSKQSHGVKLDQSVADLAWTNMLPYMPTSLDLNPDGLAKARKFFAISPQAPDELLIDNSFAKAVQHVE
jgi:NitT/TauT family transport system substrate-binding protein